MTVSGAVTGDHGSLLSFSELAVSAAKEDRKGEKKVRRNDGKLEHLYASILICTQQKFMSVVV